MPIIKDYNIISPSRLEVHHQTGMLSEALILVNCYGERGLMDYYWKLKTLGDVPNCAEVILGLSYAILQLIIDPQIGRVDMRICDGKGVPENLRNNSGIIIWNPNYVPPTNDGNDIYDWPDLNLKATRNGLVREVFGEVTSNLTSAQRGNKKFRITGKKIG